MALESGSRLGQYEVVIKVLPQGVADTKRLPRFEQEARAAGALNHPSALAVYDVGTEDGAPPSPPPRHPRSA